MIFTKRQLNNNISYLKPFAEKDQTVELEIRDGYLRTTAIKDGNFLILKNIPTNLEDIGPITINKQWLENINKQKVEADEEIKIRVNKKSISTKVNNIRFNSHVIMNKQIDLKEDENIKGVKFLLTKDMIETMNIVSKFAEGSMKRPILNGVNFTFKNKELKIMATDSYKAISATFNTDVEEEISITIPKSTVEILTAIGTGAKGIPLVLTESNLYINSKQVYFKSYLLADKYPAVYSIIERAKNSENITEEILFQPEGITKLKSIRDRKYRISELRFDQKTFSIKTGTGEVTNELLFDHETEEKLLLGINYDDLVLALDIIPNMEFKKDMFLFKQGGLEIILMGIKIEGDEIEDEEE